MLGMAVDAMEILQIGHVRLVFPQAFYHRSANSCEENRFSLKIPTERHQERSGLGRKSKENYKKHVN